MSFAGIKFVKERGDGTIDVVSVSAKNPLPTSGGGGSDSGAVKVSNFPAIQTVTGPVTNAQLGAVTGTATVAAWAGIGSGTAIAILKAIYAQNESIKTILGTIAANTARTP